MMQRKDSHLAVVDVGQSKIRVLVADVRDGAVRYCGHAVEPARGI